MFRSRLHARITVDDIEIVYLNVYPPHIRRTVTKADKYTKRMASINDYSLSGMKIRTSAFMYPNQRLEVNLRRPEHMSVPAEVVGLRRRFGTQYEYGIRFLLNQQSYFDRGKYDLHPIRRFHQSRLTIKETKRHEV